MTIILISQEKFQGSVLTAYSKVHGTILHIITTTNVGQVTNLFHTTSFACSFFAHCNIARAYKIKKGWNVFAMKTLVMSQHDNHLLFTVLSKVVQT